MADEGRIVSVLVVEDNPGDLALIRHMLQPIGAVHFEIFHGSTLAAALVQMQHDISIVLLDLNLPDSHGLNTLVRFREKYQHIPIIVLTGVEQRGMKKDTLDQGADDYLMKNDVKDDLLARAILQRLNIDPWKASRNSPPH